MLKRTLLLLSLVAACGIISTAYGQMFNAKSDGKKVVPGINKIPPLLPVLSPGDFQSTVKSLSEQNRTDMTKQGLDTIQQQRDALPSEKPGDPPPLAPPPKPESGKDSPNTNAPAAAAATPAQNTWDTTDEDTDNDNSNSESASSSNSEAPGSSTTPASNNATPSKGGQLNIQY